MRHGLAWIAALCLALASTARARPCPDPGPVPGPVRGPVHGPQDPPAPAPAGAATELCPTCHGTGRLAVEIQNSKLAELEAGVLYCSERIARDGKAKGIGFLPCAPKCQAPTPLAAASAEFRAREAEVDAWTAGNAEISKTLKPRVPFVFVRTQHFDLIYGLPKITLETREVLDLHAGAHWYANRLEQDYAWFMDLLQMKDEEMRVLRHKVFLFDDVKSLVTAAPRYADLHTDRSGHKVGEPSVLVTWRDKAVFGKSNPAFHQHVVHHLTHMIQGVWLRKEWLAERAGWLDEGLAHVAEMRLFGSAGNTCDTESEEGDVSDENWEPIVLKRVLANDVSSFASMMGKKAHELSLPEHQLAWSFTDFLLARPEPAKIMRTLMQGVKEKREMREVFREATGFTTVNFDDAWKAWVKENYSLRP